MYKLLIVLLCAAVYCSKGVGAEEITLASRGDANANYAISMIRLALAKTQTPFKIHILQDALSSQRQLQEILDGNIDIIWTATSRSLESKLLPVRIPLYKGLLGYRIFIVHRDRLGKFTDVGSFEDLKTFYFGQGRGWTDTNIMLANGLRVVENHYENLFYMTDAQRFDAYPRGVHEPWDELQRYQYFPYMEQGEVKPRMQLVVEPRLMFRYTMPFYLFVSPHKPELAQIIEQGLRLAIEDGSFDERFFGNPLVQKVAQRAGLSKRLVFDLENPYLPQETPVDDVALWVNINNLIHETAN